MQGQIIYVQLHLSAQYTSICFYKIGDTTFSEKEIAIGISPPLPLLRHI